MFTPIQRRRCSDEIVEQIVLLIKEGRLQPGDRLPSEREIAERLQVSRPPLREALKTLETLGFIEVRQRQKSVVKSAADVSLQDPLAKMIQGDTAMVIQLLQVRNLLESWAATEASRLASEEDLGRLAAVCRELEQDFQKGVLGVDADVRFHLAIYQAAHNTILCHIASTLLALLHRGQTVTRQAMFQEAPNREILLKQHLAIYRAIRDRDARQAGDAMRSHLAYAENYFISR